VGYPGQQENDIVDKQSWIPGSAPEDPQERAVAESKDDVNNISDDDPAAHDVRPESGSRRSRKAMEETLHSLAAMRHDPEAIARTFESGEYPYHSKLKRAVYEKNKAALQVELLKVQRWVRETGQRIVILFEGRDAAGKGGTIKRFMEHMNPRGARVVALEKPGDLERGQWFYQRYISALPTAGEMVLLDRS
jgi:polyphosphate kinase 2 (PPK2 family)